MFFGETAELLRELRRELELIRGQIAIIKFEVDWLRRHLFPLPTELKIKQKGAPHDMITGIPAGSTKHFQESLLPAGSALPPGMTLSVTWTADDPNVVLAPSADGSQVAVTVPTTDTQGSSPSSAPPGFNLTANGQSSALPGQITGTVFVPILPTPPPLPIALAINQLD